MKQITRAEAQRLISEIGHVANITVPVDIYNEGRVIDTRMCSLLNNAVVYDPYHAGKFVRSGSNEDNATTAMHYIKDSFSIYSSYFNNATGDYQIIN